MRDRKTIRIVGLFFLASLAANLYVGYLWVSAWMDSRAGVVSSLPSATTGPAGTDTPAAARIEPTLTPSPGGSSHSGIESATPEAQEAQEEQGPGKLLVALLPLLSSGPTSTPTASPTPTATPTPEFPSSFPGPEEINGVALDEIVVLSEAAMRHAREIYASGLEQGRRPDAFAMIGDSTIETPLFLARFDEGPYNLGEYGYLQAVINHYAGSFARDSVAVRVGLHSWTAIDPMWADKAVCASGETPVACELRIQQPSVAIIRLGVNDQVGGDYFRRHMEEILRYTIEQGVVPILSTRPEPFSGDVNNQVMRALAEDYDLPLWDFQRAASALPGSGLDGDAVHLTSFYAHDYTLPEALRRGHGLQNLTALMALDRVWRVLDPAASSEGE